MKQENGKLKKRIKRIALIALTVLVLIMILTAVYFMYCNINGKVAFVGKYALVKILTPSMEPTIPAGTYIIAEKIDAESVREGDVILFYSRDAAIYGKINTHRVVEITDDNGVCYFTTRGDNNPVNDSTPVQKQDVVGRYVGNAEAVGAFANFLSKPYVFLLIVIIPCAVLIALSVRDVKKKYREVRMEKLVEEEVERLKETDKNGEGKDPTDHV